MVDLKKSENAAVSPTAPPNQQPTEEVDVAPSKSTKSPAFQLYTAEFLAGDKVTRMSYMEVGIFTVLLCHAWTANGLPTNVTEIAKKLKIAPARFAKMWRGVLSECWVERGGRLVNPRQEAERKKQADFRKLQKNKAEHRWHHPGNAAALPERQSRGNALQSSSSSSSSEVPTVKNTVGTARATAPIHDTSHKKHAHCGRVCVHASQHDDFTRRRNHPLADKELRDFYLEIDALWSTGARAHDEPGDPFDFWRDRYAERWPAVVAAKQTSLDRWAAKHGVVR